MKAYAVAMLGWVLVPLLAFAQGKVALNTITSVRVNGGTVEITGSQKPNFTTFTMTDPPRLVVDISEAVLRGVPDELPVRNGVVTGLRTANYGSEASAIARVLIGYERDVETDIQVSGSVLVVKVLEGGGPAVAQAPLEVQGAGEGQAASGPTAAEAQAAADQATRDAQADRAAQEKAVADAAAAAEAERVAQEKAVADAAAAAKKTEEEQRRAQALSAAEERKRQEETARAEAEAKRVAEAEEKKRKAAEAEAKRLAAVEEKKRQEETARAEAEARRVTAAEEKKRQLAEAEARRVAEAEEKKRQLAEARAEAEAKRVAEAEEKKRKAQDAESKRVAAAEEKKRQAEEARAAAEAKRVAEAEEKRRRQEEARAARVASAAPVPRETVRDTPPAEPAPSGRRKTLEIVGFQQLAASSRVYVRTNEPAEYKVSQSDREIILELENTQIGKGNNTRALDTSFFDTAVNRVDPTPGPDRSVRVSIKLKGPVTVQTRQEGNTISLEFPRPSR